MKDKKDPIAIAGDMENYRSYMSLGLSIAVICFIGAWFFFDGAERDEESAEWWTGGVGHGPIGESIADSNLESAREKREMGACCSIFGLIGLIVFFAYFIQFQTVNPYPKKLGLFNLTEEVSRIKSKRAYEENRKNEAQRIQRQEDHMNSQLSIASELLKKGGLDNLEAAYNIYSTYSSSYNRSRYDYEVRNVSIEIAKEKENLLDYDGAIAEFERLGLYNDAKRVRRKKIDEKKVDQTVVQGDYVDDRDTIVKDSVVSKSNIGSGDDKLTKIKELKELHDSGTIDDDEFKQMKKEILGK